MTSPSLSYAAVLRTRHARRTFGAALPGRLSYGMVSLSLMLSVKEATGSYAVSGSVVALFGLAGVLLSPARAASVDRYGPCRALTPMAVAYAFLLTALAFTTWRPGVSGVLLGALAVAAGGCMPPLGPVMRTLWSGMLPDRRLLQRAYSLDAVAEELLFVTGPLLVGLLVEVAAPPAGLAASAALGGLFVSPALTTAYLLADESAGPSARTRAGAGAWANTALNAGSTGATAVTGFMVGRLPLSLCFALAAVPVAVSAAVAVVRPVRRAGDS